MKTILVITVGGSCEPVVSSINSNRPDFIYFICSDDNESGRPGSYITVNGEGLVCSQYGKENKPSIANRLSLNEDMYEIIKIPFKDIDNYNACYGVCANILTRITETDENKSIILDYTGGTKSMTGGLLLAGVENQNVLISVVTGDRSNLIKVEDGTQFIKTYRKNLPYIRNAIQSIKALIEKFEYQAALDSAKLILRTPDLEESTEAYLKRLVTFATVFNEWDKFNHSVAWDECKKGNKVVPEHFIAQLQFVINARRCFDEGRKIPASEKFTRYESIVDLIFNSERKAFQKKYDDATARIYRATELLAQTRLMLEYGINTSDVDISRIESEDIRMKYSNRLKFPLERIQMGLFESYLLLHAMRDPVFSSVFEECEGKMKSALEVRNYSILAHGSRSISEEAYADMYEKLVDHVIKPVLVRISPSLLIDTTQLPNVFSEPGL